MNGLLCSLCYFLSMKTTLTLILRDEVKNIFDHFAALMNISIVFYDEKGQELQRGLDRRNSDYCCLMQQKIFGAERCFMLDSAKQRECIAARSIVCYKCHAGLREAIAPLMVSGYPVGFVMIGQFRTVKVLPAAVKLKCKNTKLLSNVEEAFINLPYIAPERVDDLLGMFSLLMDYIVTKELVGLRRNQLLNKIERYIDERVSERITLEQVAEHVGRSRSTVSHLVRRKLGITFKNLLIDRKLHYAEKLMKQYPEKTIEEISDQAGYRDQFYFSRIYRKYRQITPTEYRRSLS